MKVAFGVFGIVVSIVSAMFVAMAVSDLVGGDGETSRSTLVGLLALFLGAGFWDSISRATRLAGGCQASVSRVYRATPRKRKPCSPMPSQAEDGSRSSR